MKKYIFTLIFLVIIITSKGQNIYYDALKLKTLTDFSTGKFKVDSVSEENVYAILRNYLSNDLKNNKELQKGKINSEFKKNDFINFRLDKNLDASSHAGFSGLFSSIGNLNVTAFADGLAKFLVERTKEELNEAFFRKFADFLKYYPEFKILFPNTDVLVDNFNSWEYANLLNTLREAFDKDVKELLGNFIKLKDLSATDCSSDCKGSSNFCKDCVARTTDIHDFFKSNGGIFLLSAAQLGNGILQSQKIPDIINSVTQTDFLLGYTNQANAQLESDLKNSLKLINIIGLSLKSNETARSYITEGEFNLLLNDPVLKNLYFGLLWQQISNEKIKIGPIVITDIFNPANITGVENYCANLFNQGKNVQKAFDKLLEDKLNAKADLGADYGIVFESVQQLLTSATSISIIHSSLQCPKELTDAFNLSSKTLQIAHDISVRNYNAVVIGFLKFLSDASKEYISTHPNSKISEFTAAFVKYGSFAANVATAKNADEVKDAIKSFALPAGSSSIKKHTQFNISLNAYTGFAYGIKNHPFHPTYTTKDMNGMDSTVKLNGGQSLAIYAPVGLAFNWGLGWQKKNPGSISAFISLIDIGAVVGYRFLTDTGEVSAKFKISLANIFAPGANVIIGIPNVPLSVGGGLQWIPSLQRDPQSNDFYNIDHSGIRYQIFVAVDLPLLNLHTSKKNLLLMKNNK